MGMRYTAHAVQRFVERFPERLESGVAPKVCLHRAFQGASLERGFLNDTRRLVYMMDKYGDFNFDFYIKDDIVFVVRDDTLITVISRDGMGVTQMFGGQQTRYKRKST